MNNFDFSRIFGNTRQSQAASKASKKRKGRTLRIEELENREMLAVMFGTGGVISELPLDPDVLNGSVTWVETSGYKEGFNKHMGEDSPSGYNQAQYKYLAALFNDDLTKWDLPSGGGTDPGYTFGGIVTWSEGNANKTVIGLDFTHSLIANGKPADHVNFSNFTALDLSIFTSLKELTLANGEKKGLTNLESLNVSGTPLKISDIKGVSDVDGHLGITGLAGQAAPTNVTVAQKNNSEVIVSWTQAWDATEYIVQYRAVGTEEWIVASENKDATEKLELGLGQHAKVVSQPEVAVANNIEFRVLAVKGTDNDAVHIASAKTATLTLKNVADLKGLDGRFRASAVKGVATTDSVTLNLNTQTGSRAMVGDILYYEIESTSHPELGKFYVAATGQIGQNFTIEGLKANTTYKFTIQVVGRDGNYLKNSKGVSKPLKVSAKTAKPPKGSPLVAPAKMKSAAGLNSVTLTGLKAGTYSIDVWQTGGEKNNRGYKFTVGITVDESGAAVINGLDRDGNNGIKYQFRVSQVTDVGLSQARNVSGSTVKLNSSGQFPAVRGVRIGDVTDSSIGISFMPSLVYEVNDLLTGSLSGDGYIDFGGYRIGLWNNSTRLNPFDDRLAGLFISATATTDEGRISITINGTFEDILDWDIRTLNLGIQAVATVKVGDIGEDRYYSAIARARVNVR